MKHQSIWTLGVLSVYMTGIAAAQTKTVKSGAAWSSASVISPALQPDPTRGSQLNDVAVSASGSVIAVWDQFSYTAGTSTMIGAAIQSGGRWSAPFNVSGNSTGYAMSPKAAAGADGTLAVTWIYQDPGALVESIQVAVRPAGAPAFAVATLTQRPTRGSIEPAPVVVDSLGNVSVVWSAPVNQVYVIQSATRLGSVWSAPVTVSGATTGTLYPAIAVNAAGDTGIVYSVWPANLSTYAEYVFRPATGGPWSAPTIVSEIMSASVGYVQNLLVAMDGQGLATVAYTSSGLRANRQLPSRQWAGPQTVILQPYGVSAYLSPDLALDRSGNAVLAVSVFDSTINVDRASVWMSSGTPDGVWTPQLRITDPTVPVDAYATRVTMSPDGQLAMIGWIDHYHGTVQVMKRFAGVWAAAETIGRGTAWAAFQEVLALDAGTSTFAGAIWKSTKNGTQIMAATYR